MKKCLFGMVIMGLVLLSGCSSMYDGAYYEEVIYGNEEDLLGETYAQINENDFISTADMPVSTFSTDVDTASYSNVRRMLNDNYLPQTNAVRIEELINYFNYGFNTPTDGSTISVTTELSVAPWNADHQLLMIGLKAEEIDFEETPGNNLVFLLDVSGSMDSSDKLGLVKSSMLLLVEQLRPIDRISIVTYAGTATIVLNGGDSTDPTEIENAINRLRAGGSTAGGAGIELAYQVAEDNFIDGGNNRIILATDGDFNIGTSSVDQLKSFISEKKETGVFLSVIGVGTGNIRDDIMEALADHGNGVYYYVDSILEAEKVFVHDLSGTMITVAKDVKLQIEFNPLNVKGYRLLGYENRVLDYEDFIDDTKDAGDLGSGHEVIAFYELIPAGSEEVIESSTYEIPEDLRYSGNDYIDELMSISIRFKSPEDETSVLIQRFAYVSDFTVTPSETFRFASSVVEFGLILRNSEYKADANYANVLERASEALGDDEFGYRQEFLELVQKAQHLNTLLD
ncbi:MAG: von Willebrand factor type A domain-containing protein [Acholeplasmataceae bacterium]|nr:von Willebrand factor type A domain-containing protein [Acholeplasmataceae bacterium]